MMFEQKTIFSTVPLNYVLNSFQTLGDIFLKEGHNSYFQWIAAPVHAQAAHKNMREELARARECRQHDYEYASLKTFKLQMIESS